MMRREFLALIAGATAAPRLTCAQAPQAVLRVGAVSAANPPTASFWIAFSRRMEELGYIPGQNFVFDYTNLQGQLERYPNEFAALVRRKVDVIVASGTELALRSAMDATATVPIVMVAVDYDPVALGYVTSLARPDRNVTGIAIQQIDLTEKRLQLAKEALPRLSGAIVLWDRISADQWQAAQRIAPSLDLRLTGIEVGPPPHDYDRLLSEAPRDYRGALIVLMTPALYPARAQLAEAAIRHRLGSVFGWRPYAEAGGLLTYGANIDSAFVRAADYVFRIAKGAKPPELPIEQPTRFELIVNLKTAKALGLEIPLTLLARADEVIE